MLRVYDAPMVEVRGWRLDAGRPCESRYDMVLTEARSWLLVLLLPVPGIPVRRAFKFTSKT